MDLLVQKNAVKLIGQIVDNRTATSPIIAYKPQKIAFNVSSPILQPFVRKSPEYVGVSSEHIKSFLDELQNDKSLNMHSNIILRNGVVISEASFGAYKTSVWHSTSSLCKSITGLAIGMLIDEGRLSLDSCIVDIFEKKSEIITALVHRNSTVRHLLTMSSGVIFSELGTATEEDWVKCFFESTLKSEAGKNFSYNSMNSYMLSAIVRQISGQSMMDYLRKRLFEPLGINNIHWETCPRGIEKGGWGMYILPEDAAKIGMLYLHGGVWNGKRIVSEEWLKASAQNVMKTSDDLGNYDYGYHLWVGKNQPSFLFNGMFGQNVLGFFDSDILIVSNAGNNEMFQKGSYYALVEKYFGNGFSPAERLPKNFSAERRLRKLEKSLGRAPSSVLTKFFNIFRPLPTQCASLNGKTFVMDGKIKSVGLFPLMSQVFQNNFTQGVKSFAFTVKNGEFILLVEENDGSFEIPIGFSEAKYKDIDIHGEPYILATAGSFSQNEDGNMVLKLNLSFIEIANSRNVKFTFIDENVRVDFSDHPGFLQIKLYMASLGVIGKLLSSIFSRLDPDFMDFKLKNIFEPVIYGTLDKSAK